MKTQRELAKIKKGWKECHKEEDLKKWTKKSRAEIKAYLEEFSGWLEFWARVCAWYPYSIEQYYVSRMEPSLLEHKPERINSWNPFRDDSDTERIILILSKTTPSGGTKFEGREVIYPKTIGEALDECPNSEEVTHVFSYWGHTNAAIIYKSPKGISVPKWIEKLVADEKAKIHAEVEAIDAEYVTPNPLVVHTDLQQIFAHEPLGHMRELDTDDRNPYPCRGDTPNWDGTQD